MYKRRPIGEYHVGVCTNTLCAVMGGDAIFGRLKSHLDVGNDETTADGKVTLEHVVEMYRALADAELAVIPGTSHGLLVEKAALCNAIIMDFLTKDPVPTLAPIRRA